MTKGRLLAGVAALILVAASCGDTEAPISYNDPEVWENVRSGCIETGDNELDPQEEANMLAICECVFAEVRETQHFDEFIDDDDRFRSDINAELDEQLSGIIRKCILDEAGF